MLDNAPQQRWHTSAEEMCCLMADTRAVTAPSSAAVTWFSGSVRLLVGSADEIPLLVVMLRMASQATLQTFSFAICFCKTDTTALVAPSFPAVHALPA